MRQDAMKNALRERRARGLDISIMIGGQPEGAAGGAEPIEGTDKQQKELGLAPKGSNPTQEDGKDSSGAVGQDMPSASDMTDKMLFQEEMERNGLSKGSIANKAKMRAMATKGE